MTDPTGGQPPVTPSWTPPNPYAYGYPHQPNMPKKTNGLAIASMVVSIVGLAGICAWGPLSILISPVGAILGHVARRKIKQLDEQGDGMALTGIILGWVGTVLVLLSTAAIVLLIVNGGDLFPTDFPADPGTRRLLVLATSSLEE